MSDWPNLAEADPVAFGESNVPLASNLAVAGIPDPRTNR
jgi:hypothetical protein